MRKCKNPSCGKRFTPTFSRLQKACSVECSVLLGRIEREKQEKKSAKEKRAAWAREKKERKEKLMTASDWRQLLQIAFNAYIRERDRHKPCISCDRPLQGKFDAGHFYSVGSYPNLRYNEDNVHGQCVHCNRDKHGNHVEYSLRLPARIGEERFGALTEMRQGELKLTIPETQELIKVYRQKLKELRK